jgi:hypothetical protein
MFNKLTYRQKNYGLLALLVLMLMVSYKRSFVLTLNALTELENQEHQLVSAQNAQKTIDGLRISINQLNKSIGRSDMEPDKVNQEILGVISSFSNDNQVRLHQLEATHEFQTVDFTIFSNLIAVEGNFNSILSLVYFMENQFEYARLTNVSLYTEKEAAAGLSGGKRKTTLYGKLLFQHYRQVD